jgi:hypothetical protein
METELSSSDFRVYFHPVFTDTSVFSDERIIEELSQAQLEVSEAIFGSYYRRACYYLTAHLLSYFVQIAIKAELAPGSSAVSSPQGIMTSVSVGDLSKTIEIPEYKNSDDKFLASTTFGQEFIRLRNKMGRGPLISNTAVLLTL